ncbi:hypothetical protein CRYUN_Cryun31cG0099200 [Craigia yunnanensis]
MMGLLSIGIRLEQEFGLLRIGLLYMLSGFGGSLRSALAPGRRQTISVGASAVGFLPHVDNSAHIGGFISGFLAGFILLMRPQFGYVSRKHIPPGYEIKHKILRNKCYQDLLLVIALVLLIVGYAIGLSRLFEGSKSVIPETLLSSVFCAM